MSDSRFSRCFLRPRRGSMLLYVSVLMVMFAALCSLAVDYGHVQMVKTEMQRCADETARGYIVYYQQTSSQTTAGTKGASMYSTAENPIDSASGISPTVAVQWGNWNPVTKVFSTGTGTYTAVKVTISRTKAKANPVSLVWGSIIGAKSVDVQATAVAALMGAQTANVAMPATASLYLAGMPVGSVSNSGDTLSNSSPFQVPSIPVTPGTWITFTSITGTTSILPGYVAYTGPAGNSNYKIHHGQNYDGTDMGIGSENGIADAVLPANGFTGLFLGPNAPTSMTAPATVDWTTASQNNQATYGSIQLQQPFLIGDGVTSGGVTQQFQVPKGATRLYLGVWDGVASYNNDGTLNATVSVVQYVQLVQ